MVANQDVNAALSATSLKLNTGASIPQVGLGVWQVPAGAVSQNAVRTAIELGYRHIDTARAYGNEADVGAAVLSSGVPRKDLFVTTKLWNSDQGYDTALRAFDQSLKQLKLDYVDLYLIHWPVPGKRLDSWRALERVFGEGRARAIGVSNFLVPHLEELLARAKRVPAVNQIELTPFLQRKDTRALCRQAGIVVEAYSPLTRGEKLDHPVLVEVAKRVRRTPAQVLLRWGIQEGHVVLPKSTKTKRIAENGNLFDFALDDHAMARLNGLEQDLTTGWDPADQA
jgi:diketogulonate reductase-like aldo/keto reductase